MTRIAIFATVIFAAGLVTLSWVDAPMRKSGKSECVMRFDMNTTELVVKYQFFKETLETTLENLAAGRVPLREATYCVRDTASYYCPIYLDRLRTAETGQTDDERVARNLLGHLHDRVPINGGLGRRITDLEAELEPLIDQAETRRDECGF